MTVWQRIRKKLLVLPNGCWEWQGAKVSGDYGRYKFEGKWEVAHNVLFLVMHGAIDRSMERDHLCKNRSCINPFHVEQVTRVINRLRSEPGQWNAGKTHCPKGHEYDQENTRYYRGSRFCKTCKHLWNQHQ
jgi:hypothetical protein